MKKWFIVSIMLLLGIVSFVVYNSNNNSKVNKNNETKNSTKVQVSLNFYNNAEYVCSGKDVTMGVYISGLNTYTPKTEKFVIVQGGEDSYIIYNKLYVNDTAPDGLIIKVYYKYNDSSISPTVSIKVINKDEQISKIENEINIIKTKNNQLVANNTSIQNDIDEMENSIEHNNSIITQLSNLRSQYDSTLQEIYREKTVQVFDGRGFYWTYDASKAKKYEDAIDEIDYEIKTIQGYNNEFQIAINIEKNKLDENNKQILLNDEEISVLEQRINEINNKYN